MGPRALRLLIRYWEKLQMVDQEGGYYRVTFCGNIGVTQGDPMSPTIFNVVMEAVIRHWESMVAGKTGGHQQ